MIEGLFAADLAYLQTSTTRSTGSTTGPERDLPPVPALVPLEGAPRGGILGYPLDQLHEEVAFVAYHFHWPHDEIMALEHAERRAWVREISALNQP